MSKTHLTLIIFGRCLISLFFIFSAIYKMIDWAESERALISVFGDWQVYTSAASFWQQMFSFLMSWAWVILAGIVFLELTAGVLIFLGYKVKLASAMLILFLALITVLLHHFWFLSGERKELHMMVFFKNLAVLGSLLILMTVDTKKSQTKSPFGARPSSLSNLNDPFK